ncbi:uncharacterized protein LOC144384574 [Gasterosteus aculeatus]
MADSGLFWVLVAAVVVSTVVLAVVCLRCRRGPQVCISPANISEDYLPSPQFRVIHPSQTNPDLNFAHHPSNQLSPHFPSADPQNHRRHRSFTPTETESNPSYENPADGPDYINAESDAEDPGYIMVLPEEPTAGTTNSRASTPSSDVQHDYENVPEKKLEEDDDDDSEEENYVNVPGGVQLTDAAQRPSFFSSSSEE